jgi:hypothetical protein
MVEKLEKWLKIYSSGEYSISTFGKNNKVGLFLTDIDDDEPQYQFEGKINKKNIKKAIAEVEKHYAFEEFIRKNEDEERKELMREIEEEGG